MRVPRFLEKKLKRRYGADSSIPYKIMNSLGYMRGNQETAAGRAAEQKHKRDVKSAKRTGRSVTAAGAARRRQSKRANRRG